MEDGKRLENLSWRLWNRETFCCAPDAPQPQPISPHWSFAQKRNPQIPTSIPALSSSVESDTSSSDSHIEIAATHRQSASSASQRPRHDSTESRSRGREKHITPIDLEKIVTSIKEQKALGPLDSLPMPISTRSLAQLHSRSDSTTTPRASSPPHMPSHMVADSSTSTVATAACSDLSEMSPPAGSDSSTSTNLSAHSVVRGFSPGQIASSYHRSVTKLATPPAPILKSSQSKPTEMAKKKGAKFTLGAGSSGEGDESSFETRFGGRSLPEEMEASVKASAKARKQTSFKDEVTTRTYNDKSYESEEVFESDSDAIDDDDEEEGEWEDEEDASKPASLTDEPKFPRIESRVNLTSRRSLLTNMMHEKDRAQALQNAASRSTPAIARRSKTSSPHGPSLATSPKESAPVMQLHGVDVPRSKPIIMTTSNTHPPALSPRTTRRNMLSTELTESLRKHLLWERQQKNTTSAAALKRRHTAHDMKNLKAYPEPAPLTVLKENTKDANSWNNYFDTGLQEYHERGW